MKYFAPVLLGSLITLIVFTGCQTEKSRNHNLTDPTKERADQPSDTLTTQTPLQVIQLLYDALNKHQYKNAYHLWSSNGEASGQTLAEFKQGYAQTAETEIFITGKVTKEGAAGSLYATVPVRIEARLQSGKKQTFTGSYVLRKRNINPDSLPNPWRIYDARLTKKE